MFFRWFEGKKFRARITPQALKMLLVINYAILLSALLVILLTPPASGYEFSIYDAYPNYFWCLIITSIFLGQICAVLSVLDDSTGKYWPLGFLAAVIANCLLLFLPVIRGYFIYGSGDILTHIGYMKDIGNYASIGSNHYPILHMLGFSMHEFTGLSFGIITMIIPPIFSILSIFFWYILGREMFDTKIGAIFLVILGSLPLLGASHILFAPNHQANLLIPLVLYGLIKSQNTPGGRKINIILIALSVLIVFFHPLVAVVVMLIYALFHFLDRFFKLFSSSNPHTNNLWMIIVIMGIIFSIWSSYIHFLVNTLDPLISSIMGTDPVESELLTKLDLVSKVDTDIIYLIKLGLLTYGVDAILGLLSIICILGLLITYIRRENVVDRRLFFAIICFAVFFILGVTIFLTINEFGYVRVYRIARIFSLLVISSTILSLGTRLKNIRNFKKLLFCVLICVSVIMLTVLSIFTFHPSPIVKMTSQHVSEGDYYGTEAFFEKRDVSISILEYGISQKRFYDLIYGVHSPRVNIKYSREGDLLPPDHFGYKSSYYLGSNYDEKQYFLLTPQGKQFYENMYPEFPDKWRFTDQDFERLMSDASTFRIYSNDNLEVYLIYPFDTS